MTLSQRLHSLLILGAPAALAAALFVAPVRAVDQPEDKDAAVARPEQPDAAAKGEAAEPGTAKDDADKAPQAAKVSPEAKQVIEQVDAAYSKLKSLELAGTFS